jgi:hypothetical protein
MSAFFCGECGSPTTDPGRCPHCPGPVFDLSTPRGVIDCRTYRALSGEQTRREWGGYAQLLIGLPVMFALVGLLGITDGVWRIMVALTWVLLGAGYAVYRWTRLPAERTLDARLGRPDPFHDPNAPEPPRARRPATDARA